MNKRLAEEVERQVEENKRNKTQGQHVGSKENEDQNMNEATSNEQQRKRNREQEENHDHNASASSSGIPRDSSGKAMDTEVKGSEASRNAKRTISDEGQTEESEKKVLDAAPEQGLNRARGPGDDGQGGSRNSMSTDLNQVDQEGIQ